MRKIKLTKNKVALIDDEDFKLISQFSWNCTNNYAQSNTKQYMHRMIMKTPICKQIDHINGNRLDNRKSNLRLVNNTQNNWNKNKTNRNTSGYVGICWDKNHNSWLCQIKHYSKVVFTIKSKDIENCAYIYDQVILQLRGEFARTNFNL